MTLSAKTITLSHTLTEYPPTGITHPQIALPDEFMLGTHIYIVCMLRESLNKVKRKHTKFWYFWQLSKEASCVGSVLWELINFGTMNKSGVTDADTLNLFGPNHTWNERRLPSFAEWPSSCFSLFVHRRPSSAYSHVMHKLHARRTSATWRPKLAPPRPKRPFFAHFWHSTRETHP